MARDDRPPPARLRAALTLAATLLAAPASATEPPLTAAFPAPRGAPPALWTLAWREGSAELEVLAHEAGTQRAPRSIATVPVAEGGAFRGALRTTEAGGVEALVAAQQRLGARAASYQTALFRVREDGSVTRLLEGLTDASAPLVTARGSVLVQRGSDGPEVPLEGQVLRERTDALAIDAVDPRTGVARTVWRGEGQLAFLATALRDDLALLYHVTARGAFLVVLDAATGAARTLAGPMPALARDFSYDRARDAVLFARAASGARDEYELVALALRDGSARALHRAASDRLMPRAACGLGALYSAAGGAGLALQTAGPNALTATLAPLGTGTDATVALSRDCAWVALRHTTLAPHVTERHALYAPGTRALVELTGVDGRALEVLGFVEAVTSPRGEVR